jgi:hypothetical protein
MRYRDPNCECEVEYPGAYRRWCENCRSEGPLPGSLADPQWEQRHTDPAVLREAADRLNHDHPEQADSLRREADRLEDALTATEH